MKKTILSILLFFAIAIPSFSAQDSCKMEIGMNLRGINLWWREYEQAFVDVMKSSLYWQTQNVNSSNPNNTNVLSSIPLDSDGYPLSLPVTVAGQSQAQVVSTSMLFSINGDYPKGIYIMLYEGTGTFEFSGDAKVQNQSAGRIELNVASPSNSGIILKILSSSISDHVRNIRVIMPGKESTYLSNPFNPAFLDKISPFKTYRYVWWTFTNGNDNVKWENRRKTTYYNQGNYAAAKPNLGCAYEYVINLSNQTKTNPWINVPTQADTNYIAKMAELFRDSLDPNLKIYLEYSNEVWNPVMWTEQNWVSTNGPSNLPNTPQKYAYFAKRTFDIWKSIFGSSFSSRVVRVAACQKGNAWVGQQTMAYLSQNGGADALAMDGYIELRPKFFDSLDVLGANATVPDVMRMMRKSFDEIKVVMMQNKTTATTYKLPIIIYEGGQSLVPKSDKSVYNNVLFDAQIDPDMYKIYNELLSYVRDSVEAKLFMHFNLVSDRKNNTLGSFGSLESVNISPPYKTIAPKYQALLDNICSSTSPPPTKYTLTVINGSGSNSYLAGDTVTIVANKAKADSVFDKWTGEVSYIIAVIKDSTRLIMPAKNISVTATYKKVNKTQYILKVNLGYGTGVYYEGDTVNISSITPNVGEMFVKWTGDVSTIIDVNKESTKLIMPAKDIIVSASFKKDDRLYYTLTVSGGYGGGQFREGDTARINTISVPGFSFDKWTGDTAYVVDVFKDSTKVVMPAKNISVQPNFKKSSFYLLVFVKSKGLPIPDATVTSDTMIRITNASGYVSFLNVSRGEKNLSISLINYETYNTKINLISDSTITINIQKTSIEDDYNNIISNIVPNPASEFIYISNPQKELRTIEIINELGFTIFKQDLIESKISLSNFNNGIYFVKIKVGNEYHYKKFVVYK